MWILELKSDYKVSRWPVQLKSFAPMTVRVLLLRGRVSGYAFVFEILFESYALPLQRGDELVSVFVPEAHDRHMCRAENAPSEAM
jgi:hypothetical protein